MATKMTSEQIKSDIIRKTRRFQKALDAYGKKHKKWQIIDMFDRGEQWDKSQIPPWVPKPVTNIIRSYRILKRANLVSNVPKATFLPEYPEDAELITQLQKAYDYVWEKQKVARTVRWAYDRAFLRGTSVAYVYYDPDAVGGRYFGPNDPRNSLYKGDIFVKLIPVQNFFPDPDAYELEDCKWIETTELVPLWKIKENPAFRQYCKDNGTLDKLKNLTQNQLEGNPDANGTILDRDYIVTNANQDDQDYMATLHTHWERYYKDGKWHLDVTYYLANTDFYLLKIEDYKPNEYPFALLYDEKEDQDIFGTSTAMDLLETQKLINKVQQVAGMIGTLHQNPQKVVTRESGINAQEMARTGNLPSKVWTSNIPARDAVQILQPPDIPRGLFELDDRMQVNLRNMLGISEAYEGQSVGSLTTSTGVDSLINRATIRDRDKMLQIDDFVERISHLIMLNIIYNWQDKRMLMTVQPNGQPEFTQFNPVDELTAENLCWRVKSNVYVKAPMTQESRRQQADKAMQMQLQFGMQNPDMPPIITPEEWIKFQEFDDGQEMLARIQRDRARIETQKQQDLAGMMTQVAQAYAQSLRQGVSEQTAQQQIQQLAQQLIQQQQRQQLQMGTPPSAPGQVQYPNGPLGQGSLANMVQGQ